MFILYLGLAICCISLVGIVAFALTPSTPLLPMHRRRPVDEEPPTGLGRLTDATIGAIERIMQRRGWTLVKPSTLEEAGLKLRPADFIILVLSSAAGAALAGLLLSGPLLALLFAVLAPVGANVLLKVLSDKRRAAFQDQMEDSLQQLAGSLRAGHSLLRAIDAVSKEAEAPSSEEYARIVNETRIGRDLGDALTQTAQRMRSEDFEWVAQAIEIHREVGGDLADVLDQVAGTIRERNQIKRQVKALSAEGKLSALVLMALPFGIILFLSMSNPAYVGKFFKSPIGYGLLAGGVILLIVGGLWLRKVVRIKF